MFWLVPLAERHGDTTHCDKRFRRSDAGGKAGFALLALSAVGAYLLRRLHFAPKCRT